MPLRLGGRTYDLTTRALVVAASGTPPDVAQRWADLVEVDSAAVPVFAMVTDDDALERALTGGAVLLRLTDPAPRALERCAAAGAAVMVAPEREDAARAAGLPADRIVPEALLLDVTDLEHPLAATAVGVVRGARVVRTADVRGARRICDVLAAVMEAR